MYVTVRDIAELLARQHLTFFIVTLMEYIVYVCHKVHLCYKYTAYNSFYGTV